MPLAHAQVAAATTATQLAAARQNRIACVLVQHGDAAVYIGSSGVTTSNGAMLAATTGAQMTVPGSDAIYGIVGTGTETVGVLEILA